MCERATCVKLHSLLTRSSGEVRREFRLAGNVYFRLSWTKSEVRGEPENC